MEGMVIVGDFDVVFIESLLVFLSFVYIDF